MCDRRDSAPSSAAGKAALGLGLREALDAARKPYPCTASGRWLQV